MLAVEQNTTIRREEAVDGIDADTRIAALKAIVQTLVLEHYWEEDEAKAKQRFLDLAGADHPVAMAVVNELTDEEFDAAFRWPRGANGDTRSALPATPVVAFLTEEQYERARVAAVVEDEGDRAQAFATQEPGGAGAGSLPASERVRMAQEQFVSSMLRDLAARRGEEAGEGAQGTVEERISAMPEPWRSRAMRELARLQEDLAELLSESGESWALDGPDANAPTQRLAR